MLSIMICEDNDEQRLFEESIVKKYLFSGDFDMNLALTTKNPWELIEHLETHQGQSGIYLLDIDLQSDINGIELAAKIKELDVSATIVFITSYSDMVNYVFKFKVEAMEYILKDSSTEEIERRVVECIDKAYQRFLAGKHSTTKYFSVKVGRQMLNFAYDNILFFESGSNYPNRVVLHTLNDRVKFYGTIADVSNLEFPFFKCHQSFVVNTNHNNNYHHEIHGIREHSTVLRFLNLLKY